MDSIQRVEEYLFGILDKKYCLFFYYASILMFIFFVFGCLGVFISAMKSKTFTSLDTFESLSYLINYFLGYFSTRLLYSMCLKL